MNWIKPNPLSPGDTVAVLSPSWGGPSQYPQVFDRGLRNLENMLGLQIKEYPTARMDAHQLYKDPELRAKDINNAFQDESVQAIFASIGGDDSVRILPFLDTDAIRVNPKIFMGFSDTTAINAFLNRHGLITLNGPSIMAGLAHLHHLPEEFVDHYRNVLFGRSQKCLESSTWYCNEYQDWSEEPFTGQLGKVSTSDVDPQWLQGSGIHYGRLFGGCIEVLEFLKGTPFWPDLSFFDNTILFFETSEDKPTVNNVKYMLRNYGSMGVLDRVAGILFGRARSYSPQEKIDLNSMIIAVVNGEFGVSNIPIISNLNFGHTEPQWIMPLGIQFRIDCSAKELSYAENPTN
jgi:muramoyltetrapeptide carboxypeptidase LdcA involved in peptidoglycan recycling